MKYGEIIGPHLIPMLLTSLILFVIIMLIYVWINEYRSPGNKFINLIYKTLDKIPYKYRRKIIINKLISFSTCMAYTFILGFTYYEFKYNDDLLKFLTDSLLKVFFIVGGGTILSLNIFYGMFKYLVILSSKQ